MENIIKERIIENPVVKDRVTFLQTVAETKGKITWIEVELAPKGGVSMHYHDKFTETFIAVKGKLGVEVEGEGILYLENGSQKKVPINTLHRFFNPSDDRIVFQVKIEPGSRNFEQFLQVMYGLARDGKTNKDGIPKSPVMIGAVSMLGETLPPKNSMLSRLSFVFNWLGKKAKKNGVYDQLITEYVKF